MHALPRPLPHVAPAAAASQPASEPSAAVAPFRHRFIPWSPRTLPTRELRPLHDISREFRASWRRRARRLWCD